MTRENDHILNDKKSKVRNLNNLNKQTGFSAISAILMLRH